MTPARSIFADQPEASQRLAKAWFTFAVAALGVSTFFALLLIVSRTPGLGALLPIHDFFYTALALHVDLSVIVWMLAAGSALLALVSPGRAVWIGWLALIVGSTGAALIAMGALPGSVEVLKSNYVPVLRSWPFLAGLGMFGIAAALMALRTIVLLRPWKAEAGEQPVMLAAYGAAWGVLLAAAAAVYGLITVPGALQPAAYFEQLFWGMGHILQLANMLFMVLVWLWLANSWGIGEAARSIWFRNVLLAGLLPLLAVPVLLFIHPPATEGYKVGFTGLMRWGSWLAAVPLGIAILGNMRRSKKGAGHFDTLRTGLQLSILLFFSGMAIGSLIRADNVMVPAHYHGAVGAVTLALMTMCLHQLPRLGIAPVRPSLARWQLVLYGGGTLIMALSLAVSGWMGVARKLPGDIQMLTGPLKLASEIRTIAMSFAGLGGVMAVTGSVLFVVGVLAALGRKGSQKKEETAERLVHGNTLNQPPSIPPCQGGSF